MLINCFLTRRCNLKCDYCRITRDYEGMPSEYPRLKEYYKNEKDADWWIRTIDYLNRNVEHDPFFILYGGEPTLYKDFEDLVKELYKRKINFTIITNATQPDKILNLLDYIPGLTCSVDPSGISMDVDREYKSQSGINLLATAKRMKPAIDAVAEVVIDRTNVEQLPQLVRLAESLSFRLSITIIETALSSYYDFAIADEQLLMDQESALQLKDLLLHYKANSSNFGKVFLNPEAMLYILDRGPIVRCNPLKMNYLSIDSDGSLRLCLRIRGVEVPKLKMNDYWNKLYSEFLEDYSRAVKEDLRLCLGCSWTCAFMTKSDFRGA